MGETVALYRVWDPSSVEHYLETAFPETRDFQPPPFPPCLPPPLPPTLTPPPFLLSPKATVTSLGRFPLGSTSHLYSESKGFRRSVVLTWFGGIILFCPVYIFTSFHLYFIFVIPSMDL